VYAFNPFNPLPPVIRDLQAFAACGGRRSIWVPPKPLTEGAFRRWLADAQPGDALQYHEGHLLLDRSETASDLPAAERRRVDGLASQVWNAREGGLLHLFSQCIDEGHFRYVAIRSSRPVSEPDFPEPSDLPAAASIPSVSLEGESA
jgi:hypothetical protein